MKNKKSIMIHLKKIVCCVFLLTLWTGCTKEDLGKPIDYEVIFENHLSNIDDGNLQEQYLVFKNETDWDDYILEIEQISGNWAENLRRVNINFNESNLIIIIGKYYNTCCSTINVNGVYKKNSNIEVKYNESGPGELQAISQAYILLKIPE